MVEVTVLYFDGCPNWRTAEERVAEALGRLGRTDVAIARQRVVSQDEAETWRFRGSPSVLVDGRDVFAEPGAPVGLSCRVYATDEGVSGAPTVAQLMDVLRDGRPAWS